MARIGSQDKRVEYREARRSNRTFDPVSKQEQTVSVMDLISEGPIYGLVNGQASIFLDSDRVVALDESAQRLSELSTTVSITNGSTSATINSNGQDISVEKSGNKKYITVKSVYNTSSVSLFASSLSGSGSRTSQKEYVLTSSGAFFTSDMVDQDFGKITENRRLTKLTRGSKTIKGRIVQVNSSTTAVFRTAYISNHYDGIDTSVSYSLGVDVYLEVEEISGTSITLASPASISSGAYRIDFTGGVTSSSSNTASNVSKYKNVTTQFRVGELLQPPLQQHNGVGNIAITGPNFSSTTIEQSTNFGGGSAPVVITGTDNSGFGLTGAQASEVDEIRYITTYSSLFYRSTNTGNTYPANALYQVELGIKRGATWEAYTVIEENRRHTEEMESAVAFEEVINLESYKPFEDFRIRVSRKTPHDGTAVDGAGNELDEKYEQFATAAISSVTAVIKEPLSLPYSSYAAVTFSSKDFSNTPERTYHCKGMKVQVPSNYVTRDESSNGVASYNRNVTTGAIESDYQDWDGSFREDKVYTNNPAWVFYDIVINNRYGLGSWITTSDIDKFALYRVARYCDELVPDGNGGQEPRFTANLYLTKGTDAYKILKDMATIFRGILYWMDGALVPIIDQAKDPVFTFSKGNVIDGRFNYENTGSKTRANQVVVSWNNPEADYKLEPLLVEDKVSIIETGRIVKEEVVAFGATSEGQATRFGRWKLWTAINQTEVVSFESALNSAFLAPGDVVYVQDADRYATTYSGRVSATGTLSATQIPLDREITLNSGSTYELSILLTKPAAFLTQESVSIGGTTYNRGDLVPEAYINGTLQVIDSEEDSVNAKASASASEALLLSWQKYSRVETREVSTASGNVTALTVSEAFSDIPAASTIWALKELNQDGATVAGSKKAYKILAISEKDKNTYSITAVEHYNEKFDAVDKDFTAFVEDPVYPALKSTDSVPEPRNLYISKNVDYEVGLHDVFVSWEPPTGQDFNGDYEHLTSYELEHDIPGYENPIFLGKNKRSFRFLKIPDGSYILGIRTVNSLNNRSKFNRTEFDLLNSTESNVPRGPTGIPIGGIINVGAYIGQDGVASFNSDTYSYTPISKPFSPLRFLGGGGVDTFKQDCSDIPTEDFSVKTNVEKDLDSFYILFDYSDTADPLKLIKYRTNDFNGLDYWYNAGTGNVNPEDTFIEQTGTVAVNSTVVTGDSSSFTTEYTQDDIIRFGTDKAAKVVTVYSDTELLIDRSFTVAITGETHYRQELRTDKTLDGIIGKIWNDTTEGFQAVSYLEYNTGNFSDIYDIALDEPQDPELYITISSDRRSADIRIDTAYASPDSTKPDYFMIFYSVDDIPNQLELEDDEGSKLRILDVNAESSFDVTAASGSTLQSVKIANANLQLALSGMWWVRIISGTNGTTQHFKVHRADSDTLYLKEDEEFPFVPEAGDTVNILEVSFHDSRLEEFRLGYVDGEVIKHRGVGFDGQTPLGYYIDVVDRAAEGTTQADQSFKTFNYYPAFGIDTVAIDIPIEEFEVIDNNLEYAGNIPLNVPSDFSWASITCCFVKRGHDADGAKWLRSNIVPLTVRG